MYKFTLTGTLNGWHRSKDGSTVYFQVSPDRIDNAVVEAGDQVGPIDMRIAADKFPAGINGKISVEGYGYNGQREWINPQTQKAKTIENTRMHAKSIKALA